MIDISITDKAAQKRSFIIDLLKGISIIAIVLYHFNGEIFSCGYLGVDVFLVIGGYLMLRTVYLKMQDDSFRFGDFFFRKVLRIWPLVLMVSTASLIAGYFLMLPDDYENLAESVIASSFFANNILQCVTTKNYWDVVNQYKPLMHLWYVGVLMQAYFFLPAVYSIFLKNTSGARFKKRFLFLTVIIFVLSLISYSIYVPKSIITDTRLVQATKFYLLPSRLFELTIGGFIFYYDSNKLSNTLKNVVSLFLLCGIIVLLFSGHVIINSHFMLLSTVLCTTMLLSFNRTTAFCDTSLPIRCLRPLSTVGKASYSIYIWHQFLLAFIFYSVFQDRTVSSFLVFFVAGILISVPSYSFIENKLASANKSYSPRVTILSLSTLLAAVICSFSLYIYLHAGTVRDVPEMNIRKDNAKRNMHAAYGDRPYQWDKDFDASDRMKILVIGNSFGRDWANILYEYDSSLNISYFFASSSMDSAQKQIIVSRIQDAEIVFYATGPKYDKVPEYILSILPQNRFYIVGNKSFGESNGIIYSRRFSDDYHDQTVGIPSELKQSIERDKEQFGSRFIDMMAPVMQSDGRVRVFTDDNKFISQDCRHLTQAGCQYYSRILDIESLLVFDKD